MATRLLIDTDGGIDDAVALWWALTAPDVEVVAITTVHGNVDVETATANVCRILEAAGAPDIPVAGGANEPFGPAPDLRPADFIHGTDGLGETFRPAAAFGAGSETAVELLNRLADQDVVLVTLGPLTNIAHCIAGDAEWAGRWKRLVVMGGTVLGPGNAFPVGEANIAHDPASAALVATAAWTEPPLLVGLDATHRATLTATEFEALERRASRAAEFLADPMMFYRRFAGTFCAPGECPCHDVVAVIAAARPTLVTGPVLPLGVQAEPGPAWGATVVDRRQPFFERGGAGSVQDAPAGFAPWEIGLDVDVDAFRRELGTLFG
ncbi:MAG: nucleoside hydrolase [Ilumatobacteraceae bacterium]